MPSLLHQELVELFRNDPLIAVEQLRGVPGLELPAFDHIEVKPGELSALVPVEYRADVVLLMTRDKPVFASVVEVQLHIDPEKLYSWPLYAPLVRMRYRCPTCLLVYTQDSAVAAWAAKPITTGQPGCPFVPVVRGPSHVPRVTDAAEAARSPYRAVFSAVAHGHEPGAEQIGRAALEGIGGLTEDERSCMEAVILEALGDAARSALEEWMNLQGYPEKSYFYQRGEAKGKAEGRVEGKAEGRVEGEARMLLRVLDARTIALSEEQRVRVLECTDTDQLEAWALRALTATSAADVFGT